MGFLLSQACYSPVISQKHGQFFFFFLVGGTLIMFFLPSSSLQNIKGQEKKSYKHPSISEPVGSVKFCFQISKPLNSILLLSFQPLHLAVGFICCPKA